MKTTVRIGIVGAGLMGREIATAIQRWPALIDHPVAAKVTVLGAVLAAGEVFLAKLRLFRVPELLAGSFVLALLAVAAAFFLGAS